MAYLAALWLSFILRIPTSIKNKNNLHKGAMLCFYDADHLDKAMRANCVSCCHKSLTVYHSLFKENSILVVHTQRNSMELYGIE